MDSSNDIDPPLQGKPRQSSYTREEIIEAGEFETFGPGNARLPTPDMLMFDRINHIDDTSGRFNKGGLLLNSILVRISGSSSAIFVMIR